MKTATSPSLRIDPALRDAAEGVLQEGETLTERIETAVREAIQRRRLQTEFLARGLDAGAQARRTGLYHPADLDLAQRAIDAVTDAVEGHLSRTPFIFRKASASPFLRERVIPFDHAGCVVLYEIENATTVDGLALRHQRQDDYH